MGMFDGIVSGGIGAIGSLIGGSQANQKSWDIAMATNQANAQEAQKTRDWQTMMRATQYQAAVEDLQKSGLNPMLAYTQGGAGTPAGATATAVPATVRDAITPAVHTALSAMSNKADIELKEQQATATSAQAEVNRTQALQNIADTAKKEQDTKTGTAVEEVNREQLKAIAAEIRYKDQATRTSSAEAGRIAAETRNVQERNPPWWARFVQDNVNSSKSAWSNFENSPLMKDLRNLKKGK